MGLPVCRSITFSVGLVIAIIGAVLGFVVFPNIIEGQVADSLAIVKGSEAYERWENIPVPLKFKVYFFNVTNPKEVSEGKKPIVNEIGPFVYDQTRTRVKITEENDTLSFSEQLSFTFNEEASGDNKEDTPFTIVNLPLMSVVLAAEVANQHGLLKPFLEDMFIDNPDVFMTTTPKKFLFDGIRFCPPNSKGGGYKKACDRVKSYHSKQLVELPDGSIRFSLLSHKNLTSDETYKINSGSEDIAKLGEVLEWRNSSKLSVWKEGGTCNNIYGTDATVFPPFQNDESKIAVFQSDICRSVDLQFDGEVEYKDVSGIRFIIKSDMLNSSAKVPANECFCVNYTKGLDGEFECLSDGAMELYTCLQSPIVMTFPHMLGSDEKYSSTVDGLKPNETLHKTFIEMEPTTGVILRGNKRAQFNVFFRKVNRIPPTDNLIPALVPVVWIDEGVELDDEYIEQLTDKLSVIKIVDIAKWCLIGFGLAVSLITVISFIVV